MRRCQCVLFVVAVSGAGCGANITNLAQERESLLAADKAWSQTTGDLDKFMTYFAPDASGHYTGSPTVTGTDAIRGFWAEWMKAPGFTATWQSSKAELAGDIGYTSGTYTITAGGMTEKGKYVTVWKKQADGSWKVIEDIGNADVGPGIGGKHVLAPAATLTWGDPPASLPKGAKLAVVSGDPSATGPFVLRAQLPAGYTVPAHWHPTDEHVTVLSGTLAIGMGDKLDPAALQDLSAGGYAALPAMMHHFAMARTATTIQVHGMGPFAITYVNPADDPSQ
jgi:ketosteroid isomerase-like protein